jgi:hypothetical protein
MGPRLAPEAPQAAPLVVAPQEAEMKRDDKPLSAGRLAPLEGVHSFRLELTKNCYNKHIVVVLDNATGAPLLAANEESTPGCDYPEHKATMHLTDVRPGAPADSQVFAASEVDTFGLFNEEDATAPYPALLEVKPKRSNLFAALNTPGCGQAEAWGAAGIGRAVQSAPELRRSQSRSVMEDIESNEAGEFRTKMLTSVAAREGPGAGERRLQRPVLRASSGSGRLALGGSSIRKSPSAARRDIYQDEGATRAGSWCELVQDRGRVLLMVVGVTLAAVPLLLFTITASDWLAGLAGQSEQRCGKVMSDSGGSHMLTTASFATWSACTGVVIVGWLVKPMLGRMIPFVVVSGPLALCLQMPLFVALSPRTPLGQIMLSICAGAMVAQFLADVAYIGSRVISGHKTARRALAGLAANIVTAIFLMLFGATVAAYQLVSSGSSLDLSDESLVIINCVLYPISCALRSGLYLASCALASLEIGSTMLGL